MLNRRYETDLTDAAWELVQPLLPPPRHGGRPRTTDIRAVVNAIFYLLRTVADGACFHTNSRHGNRSTTAFGAGRTLGPGCNYTAPSMNKRPYRSRSARHVRVWSSSTVDAFKTTARGGTRGFDGHKRVKGRQAQPSSSDTLGLMIANRVDPANVSDGAPAGGSICWEIDPSVPKDCRR